MMVRNGSLARMNRLSSAQWWLLVRALWTLARARIAVAMLPFKRAVAFGCVPVRPNRRRASVAEFVWAVEAAARRVPWRAMCFEQGLAVQRLLRKSGVEAVLHYGARHAPLDAKLEAHVWVTVGSQVVAGDSAGPEFGELATFP